jgi:hypothetical protein
MGRLDVSDMGIKVRQAEAVVRHTRKHDSVQLRDRLIFVQSLAASAQGLTIKTDMARAAKKSCQERLRPRHQVTPIIAAQIGRQQWAGCSTVQTRHGNLASVGCAARFSQDESQGLD